MASFTPDFGKYTDYTTQYPFNSVIFPANAPLNGEDLNEMQEIIKERGRLALGALLSDGYIHDYEKAPEPFSYSIDDDSDFTDGDQGSSIRYTFDLCGTVIYQGTPYHIENTITHEFLGTSPDLPYGGNCLDLVAEEVEVTADQEEKIYPNGFGFDSESLNNYLADNIFSAEVSRRKAVKFSLEWRDISEEPRGITLLRPGETVNHGDVEYSLFTWSPDVPKLYGAESADEDEEYEGNISKCYGYFYTNITFNSDGTATITLTQNTEPAIPTTGASTSTATFTTGYEVGDVVSIINDNKYYQCSTITAVNGNIITVDSLPFTAINELDELHFDDYCLFVDAKPEKGVVYLSEYARTWGINVKALGYASYSFGRDNFSLGHYSFTAGRENQANYGGSVLGRGNKATGEWAFAHGRGTEASGYASYAGGHSTVASGNRAFASGHRCKALGEDAHALGHLSKACGTGSFALGRGALAGSNQQFAMGKYNLEDSSGVYAFIFGNGTSDTNRSNAMTLDWSGNAWFAGTVTVGDDQQEVATKVDGAVPIEQGGTGATTAANALTNLGAASQADLEAVELASGIVKQSNVTINDGDTYTAPDGYYIKDAQFVILDADLRDDYESAYIWIELYDSNGYSAYYCAKAISDVSSLSHSPLTASIGNGDFRVGAFEGSSEIDESKYTYTKSIKFVGYEEGFDSFVANIVYTLAPISEKNVITYGTEDLTAGVSELATGSLYFVYE